MVTRPTATVTVTIDAHSDAVAEAAALRVEDKRIALTAAGGAGDDRARAEEIRARLDVLQDTIASGQIHVTVTALSAGAYRNLLKDHPPKPDDALDEKVGYDTDRFGAALIRAATLSAVDHAGQPYGLDLDELLSDDDGVTPHDFEQWFRTALALQTQGGSRVPLLRAS